MNNTSKTDCKYCHSKNVIKYGTYKGIQRYYRKDCKHKFANYKIKKKSTN